MRSITLHSLCVQCPICAHAKFHTNKVTWYTHFVTLLSLYHVGACLHSDLQNVDDIIFHLGVETLASSPKSLPCMTAFVSLDAAYRYPIVPFSMYVLSLFHVLVAETSCECYPF